MSSRGRERIQKVLAAIGVGSRRQVESWIAAGRITVNGRPATPGQPVGSQDDVRLDGRRLRLGRRVLEPHQGVLYHRPAQEGVREGSKGGEPSSIERLPKAAGRRWVPVSPLPPRDGGLELFVTDGELAAALTRRGGEIRIEYSVRIRGLPDRNDLLERLRSECRALVPRGELLDLSFGEGEGRNRWMQVQVTGLRPRDLRLALESCGLEANRILRTRLGPVVMDRGLSRGRSRKLREDELSALRDAAGFRPAGSRSTGR